MTLSRLLCRVALGTGLVLGAAATATAQEPPKPTGGAVAPPTTPTTPPPTGAVAPPTAPNSGPPMGQPMAVPPTPMTGAVQGVAYPCYPTMPQMYPQPQPYPQPYPQPTPDQTQPQPQPQPFPQPQPQPFPQPSPFPTPSPINVNPPVDLLGFNNNFTPDSGGVRSAPVPYQGSPRANGGRQGLFGGGLFGRCRCK